MKRILTIYFISGCVIMVSALRGGDALSEITVTPETELSGMAIQPVVKTDGVVAPHDPLKTVNTAVDNRDPAIIKRDMPSDIDEQNSAGQEVKVGAENVAAM